MNETSRLVFPGLGALYRALAPSTEPLIRLCAGLSMAAHGYAILFGNHEAFAAFFERAGFAPGYLWTIVVGITQFAGGLLLALGLFTRLAAVPRRPRLLAAKAAVFGAVMLAAGEIATFVSFFAGGLALRHGIAAPSLGQPGVLRAVILSGTSFCLVGLVGLGLGAVIRHTAAAVAVLVGGVYVAAQFIGFIAHGAAGYMPILIVGNSLSTTKPVSCGGAAGCPHFLSPWAGLAMLCLYAAVALAAGGWLLARRDV